ncbi:MAG: hypothetical protein ACFHU9_01415 [Fluviicola sp.]
MNNIERLELLKELNAKKATLHKENLLAHFEWDTNFGEAENKFDKILGYAQTGYGLFKLFMGCNKKANTD